MQWTAKKKKKDKRLAILKDISLILACFAYQRGESNTLTMRYPTTTRKRDNRQFENKRSQIEEKRSLLTSHCHLFRGPQLKAINR